MQKKSLIVIGIVTAILLSIPLIAMQFTEQVDWSPSDFVIMGVLVFGTGLLIDLVIRKAGKYKAFGALAVVLAFLYVWAELAVGIFTNIGS